MEQNLPVVTFQSVREDNLFKQTIHSGKVPVGTLGTIGKHDFMNDDDDRN
jgi:hypothetical protein